MRILRADRAAAGLRRLDFALAPSTPGARVPSQADLRCTARVRVCREYPVDLVRREGALILGTGSRYRQS